MKRRSFLLTAVGATVASLGGCLSGQVVEEVQRNVTVPAGRGWVHEIDSVGGSAEVGYEIRSEDGPFEVFYFTTGADFSTYQERTLGGETEGETEAESSDPIGHGNLSTIAVDNQERGAYEAIVPGDDGRVSLSIEETHYFVVDHSNYGMVPISETADDLLATVSLEVVESRF